MRIAFFILLLANLVLVLWQTQIQPHRAGKQAFPEIPVEKRLILVSERNKPQTVAEHQQAAEQPEVDMTSPVPDLGLPDIEILGGGTETDIEVEPVTAEPQRVCYTMGPFKETQLAKVVSGRLRDIGAEVSQRSKVEQEQYGYRVYLKPYASREEAVEESRKLADNGIRDYYIISDDPEKKNGISLGLFRKKSGAIRRMAQVRRFDFKPQMEIRYRDTTIYWLDFEHDVEVDSQPLWRELAEDTPEVQRLDRDCEPQA
ncbi:MAG: SPOR domain-containing protein [Gammaproteobacteria bacterium]|nr:SPOR domain-containing protein [Gammaproteobacteria bacterium]